MKNKKVKIGFIIAIIAVIIGVLVFCYWLYSKKQVEILKQELSNLDIAQTDIDMEIKAKGKFGKIESTIKNYLNDVKKIYNEIENICNNSNLNQLLSIENIKQDEPEFVATKEKIKTLRTQINDLTLRCTTLLQEEAIMAATEQAGLSSSSKKIYKTLMIGEETRPDFQGILNDINNATQKMNATLDNLEEIINFLSNNKDGWEVQNDKIQFKDLSTLTQYYQLLNSIADSE